MEEDDEGVYTCQVITKHDMAEASGTLTLWGKINEYVQDERVAFLLKPVDKQCADSCSDDIIVVPLRSSRPSCPAPDH